MFNIHIKKRNKEVGIVKVKLELDPDPQETELTIPAKSLTPEVERIILHFNLIPTILNQLKG